MAIQFLAPSYRASSSDLTIAVSPLGLVELADEEFEVHGPRLNRYATGWAHYLGHHWSYRRPQGESQLTFNYVRAMSDYLTNFCFGKGVKFTTPRETEGIVPYLLERIWSKDNDKLKTLWEIGNLGSVCGDVFVKVAYEDPYVDPSGRFHPGRVRILPLNPSHCFPEFHPHDRSRLQRLKIKYRFWGCVDPETEALTARGWKRYSDLTDDDVLLTRNPTTDAVQWERPKDIHVYDNEGAPLVRWQGPGMDALTTPNHRWLADARHGRAHTYRREREMVRTSVTLGDERSAKKGDWILTGGGVPLEFADVAKYADEFVETIGWFVTEGWVHVNQTGFQSVKISQKRPEGVRRIRRIAEYWRSLGATVTERKPRADGVIEWYFGRGANKAILAVAGEKAISPQFLCDLTATQAELLRDTLLLADGNIRRGSARWTQTDRGRVDAYQMLCAMLGISTRYSHDKVQEYARGHVGAEFLMRDAGKVYGVDKVWCPELSEDTGVWMARRNGVTYWTGNTTVEGTRQVFTYTEILTDEWIEEYVNDTLTDSRPNQLGEIPVVHWANLPATGSPWGLSDVQDILNLNREFNEKATEISDIINYHSAPVTVITGAKASQLEKGPRKVWGGLPKDAKVFNLENGLNLAGPVEFLTLMKQAMHEMTGVPESALGQMQPISNTSGVALAIQFMPATMKRDQKLIQAAEGLKRVDRLALATLYLNEPETVLFDMTNGIEPQPGQLVRLDPQDPISYEHTVEFPEPLPLDVLVKLNEIQMKMGLGLESKKQALRDLGSGSPDADLAEIFEELKEDAMQQGALDLLRMNLATITGMAQVAPEGGPLLGGGPTVTSAGAAPTQGTTSAGDAPPVLPPSPLGPQEEALYQEIATRAYGTKLPQRRNPNN